MLILPLTLIFYFGETPENGRDSGQIQDLEVNYRDLPVELMGFASRITSICQLELIGFGAGMGYFLPQLNHSLFYFHLLVQYNWEVFLQQDVLSLWSPFN